MSQRSGSGSVLEGDLSRRLGNPFVSARRHLNEGLCHSDSGQLAWLAQRNSVEWSTHFLKTVRYSDERD